MDHMLRDKVKDLEERITRLQLSFNALWELIRDQTRITHADLEAKMQEIDLRDGRADNAITEGPVRCPVCQRVSSSRHWKCLYCGQEFERTHLG
jgi:hypothetical protein